MTNQVWVKGPPPIPLIHLNEIDLFKCLHYMDSGCHNIYLAGKSGIFSGYALTETSIRQGWRSEQEGIVWQPKPLRVAALREQAFKQHSHAEQSEYIRQISTQFSYQKEIPVLDESGRISYVLEQTIENSDVTWSGSPYPDDLHKHTRIFLSSLGSPSLQDFFQTYGAKHDIHVLSAENISTALQTGLILFKKDVLPDCTKKSIIEEAKHQKMQAKAQRELLPLIYIDNKWASLKNSELVNHAKLIEKFDEGYHTVSITDDDGNFQKLINQSEFKVEFPGNRHHVWSDISVEYDPDLKKLKQELATEFLKNQKIHLREIPIIKNGKIVALGRCEYYCEPNRCFDSKRVFNINWSWIAEDVAREFFSIHKKILISSNCGFLRDFKKTFSSLVDITVYNDTILDKCLSSGYDMIIYDADNFDNFPGEKWVAHRLYCLLLLETVLRWLKHKNISIYFLSNNQSVPNIKQKLDRQGENIGGSVGYLREGDNPYFIVDENNYDNILPADELLPNYHAGRRCVMPAKSLSGHSIYFFGPCTALGLASYSPDKTIESFLQKRLNDEQLDYHVINCATEGLTEPPVYSLNWLHRLIDTPLSSGDIIVVIIRADYFFGIDNRFAPTKIYDMSTPFLEESNIEKKCFAEPMLAHMNVLGYEITADYLFHIMRKNLTSTSGVADDIKSEKISFLATHPITTFHQGHFKTWLDQLPTPIQKAGISAGAIIFSAQPIEKIHLNLINKAIQQCDFLYIFLLDNNDSQIPATEYQAMFEKNTTEKNIKVLALGKCERQRLAWYSAKKTWISNQKRYFDPVYDTYTFAKYIAPRLKIKKYFASHTLDRFERRYNIIRQEILKEENISYIELATNLN